MKYLKLICSNIKKLRLNNDLTQEEFAEKIGLTVNGVSNIERSRYQPTADTIDKICSAFNITPVELLLSDANNENEIIKNITILLSTCNKRQLNKIYEVIKILCE